MPSWALHALWKGQLGWHAAQLRPAQRVIVSCS